MSVVGDVRQHNLEVIMKVFLAQGICTKNQLAKTTGLSLATCTNLLKILVQEGKIQRIDDLASTGGRRAKRYALVEQFNLFGLVDIRHQDTSDTVHIQVWDLRRQSLFAQVYQYSPLTVSDLEGVLGILQQSYPNLAAVGLSLPATIWQDELIDSPIAALEMPNLKQHLEQILQRPVLLMRRVSVACLGYAIQTGQSDQTVALIDQPVSCLAECGLVIGQMVLNGQSGKVGHLAALPFDNREELQKSLKNKKSMTLMLARQAAAVVALLNPDTLVISCDKALSKEKIQAKITKWIDSEDLPDLVISDQLDDWINHGLFYLLQQAFSEK